MSEAGRAHGDDGRMEHWDMGHIDEALEAVLAESRFDLGSVEQKPNGPVFAYSQNPDEIVSPGALRGLSVNPSWGDEAAARARRAKVIVPDDAFARWHSAVGEWLANFVNAETGTIGHAFPMESSRRGSQTFEADGVSIQSFVSPVDDFAKGLVRGAAIMGTAGLVDMLSGWLDGEPVRYRTMAVLNGLYLNETLEPLPGIRIEPLPWSTDGAFGSLPVSSGRAIEDYLGRSVLSIASVARPAFFRPEEDGNRSGVRAKFDSGVALETVCRALALEADSEVEMAFQWHDYEDVSRYLSPGSRSTWSTRRGGLAPRGTGNSLQTDWRTGTSTVSIDEKNVRHLSEDRLKRIVLALRRHKEANIGVAVSRWCKSKEGFRTLDDQFIDLRVALEALYLKDFDSKYRGEMRFRLALYGAWYLGSNFAGRKAIRRTLLDVYDMGSRAVHGDSLSRRERDQARWSRNQALLSEGQALCRQGILKFLEVGVQKPWDDMILGAGIDEGESQTSD